MLSSVTCFCVCLRTNGTRWVRVDLAIPQFYNNIIGWYERWTLVSLYLSALFYEFMAHNTFELYYISTEGKEIIFGRNRITKTWESLHMFVCYRFISQSAEEHSQVQEYKKMYIYNSSSIYAPPIFHNRVISQSLCASKHMNSYVQIEFVLFCMVLKKNANPNPTGKAYAYVC